MKYCTQCGNELVDEAVICPACGCKVPSASSSGIIEEDDRKVFYTVIKAFMVICTVLSGFLLLPLLWTIPLTAHVCRKLKNNQPIGIGVKVCTLLFVSRVAGIMLLCMELEEDLQ